MLKGRMRKGWERGHSAGWSDGFSWESRSWWHRGTWWNAGGRECSGGWQRHGDAGGAEFYQQGWWNGRRRDVQVAGDDRLEEVLIWLRLLELNGKETIIHRPLSETVADVKIEIERRRQEPCEQG